MHPCEKSHGFLFGQVPHLSFIFRKGGMNVTEKTPELTEEEKKILKLIQTIGFGKVVVTVKNGKPVFVETQKTIQLSER